MKKPLIVAVLALVVAAGGGAWAWKEGYFEPERSKALTLYGNVDVRTVDLAFRVGGRISEMPVEEGDRVAAGDVLARLDPVPLQQTLAAAEAQVAAAQAALDKAVAGNRPQEIAQAEALVDQRKAALDRSELAFHRFGRLVKSDAISQAELDTAEAGFLEARAMLSSAEQALSLVRAGTRAEDIAAAEAALSAALAARDQAKTALEDATLTAVQDGFVLTRAREPGAIVAAGGTVYTIAIDRPVRIRAYVPEPDLGMVVPGRAVEVTTDSTDRVYHGTIGFISPTAEFTPKSVQTPSLRTDLVFRLRIIVEDPDDALRQGMPVTVLVPEVNP
ncbi:secretion protein HlyD [Aliiruegeria lutimaris]|uniref:HlyD family secretion protein n=1 Tax=Aliiruegeria lutimaris TaxID=571298 RepID=A0A1G8YLE6_9RHOB|nr:secretion protein HlyD [Aliiruegeria lutimaris]SDK03513.1 HlyD family secretion protein [Aliiruegeria lutimaris]